MEIRGQNVNRKGKNIYITINKPLVRGNHISFSISDKLYSLIHNHHHIVNVTANDKHYEIRKSTKYTFREAVPSKYPGSSNWFRYWYRFRYDNGKQIELL